MEETIYEMLGHLTFYGLVAVGVFFLGRFLFRKNKAKTLAK